MSFRGRVRSRPPRRSSCDQDLALVRGSADAAAIASDRLLTRSLRIFRGLRSRGADGARLSPFRCGDPCCGGCRG